MNKLVLTFILLKLSYNMILGAFDYALEKMETVIQINVIENHDNQPQVNFDDLARKLSVER